MKRVVAVLLTAGTTVLVAVLALGWGTPSPTPPAAGSTSFETASIDTVTRPTPTPVAKFTRTIWASTTLNRSELMLDFCRGPISIDLGDARPVLVAEHDYCGGTAWMPRLETGDAVKLSGDGVERGTYVVTEIDHAVRGKAKVKDLPQTDLVLQTCVTPEKMVLVGLELFVPSLQS